VRNTSGLKRGGPGRKKGVPNKATLEIKAFAKSVLENPTYRANLERRAIRGTLHSSIEVQLYHYAYGVPKQTFEIEGDQPRWPAFALPPDCPGVSTH